MAPSGVMVVPCRSSVSHPLTTVLSLPLPSTTKEEEHVRRLGRTRPTRPVRLGLVRREESGLNRDQVRRARARGLLFVPHAGVLRMAGSPVTHEQRLLAAVWAARGLAAASHRSSGALWNLGVSWPDCPEICVHSSRRVTLHGVMVSSVRCPRSRAALRVRHIPTTNPMATLVQLGAVAEPTVVARGVERGLIQRLFHHRRATSDARQHRTPGTRWFSVLRAVLDERALGDDRPDGDLEPIMAKIFHAYGLPHAAFQHRIYDNGILHRATRLRLSIAPDCDRSRRMGHPRHAGGNASRLRTAERARAAGLDRSSIHLVRRDAPSAVRRDPHRECFAEEKWRIAPHPLLKGRERGSGEESSRITIATATPMPMIHRPPVLRRRRRRGWRGWRWRKRLRFGLGGAASAGSRSECRSCSRTGWARCTPDSRSRHPPPDPRCPATAASSHRLCPRRRRCRTPSSAPRTAGSHTHDRTRRRRVAVVRSD